MILETGRTKRNDVHRSQGFLDRFKAGGPGFALFGTGIVKPHPPIYSQGAVPAQNALPLAQGNAIPTAVVPTNPAFPMPPSPTKESVESEKALKADLPYLQEAPASKKASETDGHPQGFAALFARQSHAMSTSTEPPQPAKPMKAKAKGQARTRKTPLPKQPRSPYSNVGLDDPAQASTPEGGKSDPALDMKPILDNLAASSPEAYMALLTEIARRTSVVPAGVPMPMIEEKPAQIHTYRPASPAASSTVSRHGKIWKNRMAHDF